MGVMASQITSLTIVYSTVYSDADQRKHQSSASLVFVRGIHRWPVNSPHKGPATRLYNAVYITFLFEKKSWFLFLRSDILLNCICGRPTHSRGGGGGGTRPENWWGCAAGRWKLDPKRSRKKLNLGSKRSIFVKVGSFCTPKDSFAVGGWEKYPKKIVLDPAKVNSWVQPPILTISSNLAIVAKLGDPKCL